MVAITTILHFRNCIFHCPSLAQNTIHRAHRSCSIGTVLTMHQNRNSIRISANPNVKAAIDFTAEWEKIYGENTMAQGCLVVNKAFAEEHPKELSKFLDDYKASVEYISEGSDDAINAIVDAGILPKAPVAKKALPNCNICFIEGKEMKAAISVFYEKLYESNNKSIAAIPDDGFYYKR